MKYRKSRMGVLSILIAAMVTLMPGKLPAKEQDTSRWNVKVEEYRFLVWTITKTTCSSGGSLGCPIGGVI